MEVDELAVGQMIHTIMLCLWILALTMFTPAWKDTGLQDAKTTRACVRMLGGCSAVPLLEQGGLGPVVIRYTPTVAVSTGRWCRVDFDSLLAIQYSSLKQLRSSRTNPAAHGDMVLLLLHPDAPCWEDGCTCRASSRQPSPFFLVLFPRDSAANSRGAARDIEILEFVWPGLPLLAKLISLQSPAANKKNPLGGWC